MAHEHRGAQRYDGHEQIHIAVAIYVRERELFSAACAYISTLATPKRPSDTFG